MNQKSFKILIIFKREVFTNPLRFEMIVWNVPWGEKKGMLFK